MNEFSFLSRVEQCVLLRIIINLSRFSKNNEQKKKDYLYAVRSELHSITDEEIEAINMHTIRTVLPDLRHSRAKVNVFLAVIDYIDYLDETGEEQLKSEQQRMKYLAVLKALLSNAPGTPKTQK